jgi:hypothetical protein
MSRNRLRDGILAFANLGSPKIKMTLRTDCQTNHPGEELVVPLLHGVDCVAREAVGHAVAHRLPPGDAHPPSNLLMRQVL